MSNLKNGLKRCPFCGSDKLDIQQQDGEYWIECEVCSACSHSVPSEANAIERWNWRVSAVAAE